MDGIQALVAKVLLTLATSLEAVFSQEPLHMPLSRRFALLLHNRTVVTD